MTHLEPSVVIINSPKYSKHEDVVSECASLYSSHFGKWENQNPIKVTVNRFKAEYLSKQSMLMVAYSKSRLIGYSTVVFDYSSPRLSFGWVTQLVVHSDYRHLGVATKLLEKVIKSTRCVAWGIVTDNPYAVRALENATNTRCDPPVMLRHSETIRNSCTNTVPYVSQKAPITFSNNLICVFTEFFTDRSQIELKTKRIAGDGKPWLFDQIAPGHEWVAVAFA